MQDFSTPMMQQYKQIKEQYKDCLLFYRMGDFYELFMTDAHIGAKILNITLTSKAGGKDGRIPMAGIPYHAVDAYLTKLVKAGHKVAICEQLSPPNKKGLVERDVVRIVTPGTILDENSLVKKENNYIVALDINEGVLAISYADISTGEFGTFEHEYDDLAQTIKNELSKLNPSECILHDDIYNDATILKILRGEPTLNLFPYADWDTYAQDAYDYLKKHFGLATLAGFEVADESLSLQTCAVLLSYLQYTQKGNVHHIKKITKIVPDDFLIMDRSTMINLELFSTIREHDTRGSLLNILDETVTPMGGRLLKSWTTKPLVDKSEIEKRYDAIDEFLKNEPLRANLMHFFLQIPDIERILARLSVNNGNARDCINLKNALLAIQSVKTSILSNAKSQLVISYAKNISGKLEHVIELIEQNIQDEPPIDLKIGGIIRDTVNPKVDTLRKIIHGSRDWILELERAERQKTGITTLKIRFNKVFGFYIEVSKSQVDRVPKSYMRKQTLVNGERFITSELKKHEEIILSAEEKLINLEYDLFCRLLDNILKYIEPIQKSAKSIGAIDCLLTFAKISEQNRYIRPTLHTNGTIQIDQGRHAVVEKLVPEAQFVPNDVQLNTDQQLLLVTGPNMAGKSVFIRQVALIVLLAQMGCFVPADNANISLVDRIFVRSGASDVITSGLSTFMVEMVETAHILHHATEKSLIVMDEIGRGTSTYDGISIAWAVAEYLVTNFKNSPKTLFATHYHELQALEQEYTGKIKNYHMSVANDSGEPIFLHTILPGGASHSFGVAVARLAGLPDEVITKAQEILHNLENRSSNTPNLPDLPNLPYPPNLADHLVHKELENLDISQITPLQALNKLADLKEKVKLFDSDSERMQVD